MHDRYCIIAVAMYITISYIMVMQLGEHTMKTVMILSLINLIVCSATVCLMPLLVAYHPEVVVAHGATLFLTTLLASFIGLGSLVVLCDD